jgi:hypothetical protein
MYGSIFDCGVVNRQLNLRNSIDQISLKGQDLVGVLQKPGSPLKGNWKTWTIPSHTICSSCAWFIRPLAKVNLPGSLPVQGGEPIACHRKCPNVIWMENKNECVQALCYTPRSIVERRITTQIFLHTENAWSNLLRRNQIIVFSSFRSGCFARFIDRFL